MSAGIRKKIDIDINIAIFCKIPYRYRIEIEIESSLMCISDDSISGFQFRYDIDTIFHKISRYLYWYQYFKI